MTYFVTGATGFIGKFLVKNLLKRNGTIYIGVTSNLPARDYQHKQGNIPGFTSQYGCKLLVW